MTSSERRPRVAPGAGDPVRGGEAGSPWGGGEVGRLIPAEILTTDIGRTMLALLPALLFLATVLPLLLWRRNADILLPASFGGIAETISNAIKGIVTEVFSFLTPILTVLGIAQVLLGLLVAIGLRQEFIGYRLIVGGALTLIFIYIVVPLLLQFI
jgi:hypothetical protein